MLDFVSGEQARSAQVYAIERGLLRRLLALGRQLLALFWPCAPERVPLVALRALRGRQRRVGLSPAPPGIARLRRAEALLVASSSIIRTSRDSRRPPRGKCPLLHLSGSKPPDPPPQPTAIFLHAHTPHKKHLDEMTQLLFRERRRLAEEGWSTPCNNGGSSRTGSDLRAFVEQENGIDYLQVYVSDDDWRVWCIDQLRQLLKESGEFTKEQLAEYDHWTMLLPEEY